MRKRLFVFLAAVVAVLGLNAPSVSAWRNYYYGYLPGGGGWYMTWCDGSRQVEWNGLRCPWAHQEIRTYVNCWYGGSELEILVRYVDVWDPSWGSTVVYNIGGWFRWSAAPCQG